MKSILMLLRAGLILLGKRPCALHHCAFVFISVFISVHILSNSGTLMRML
jgi:hypothetical protein